MSDPMTNAEVEDILSSIRRLVSDEKRAEPTRNTQPAKPVDRLVLTPALRVEEPAPEEPVPTEDQSLEPPIEGVESSKAPTHPEPLEAVSEEHIAWSEDAAADEAEMADLGENGAVEPTAEVEAPAEAARDDAQIADAGWPEAAQDDVIVPEAPYDDADLSVAKLEETTKTVVHEVDSDAPASEAADPWSADAANAAEHDIPWPLTEDTAETDTVKEVAPDDTASTNDVIEAVPFVLEAQAEAGEAYDVVDAIVPEETPFLQADTATDDELSTPEPAGEPDASETESLSVATGLTAKVAALESLIAKRQEETEPSDDVASPEEPVVAWEDAAAEPGEEYAPVEPDLETVEDIEPQDDFAAHDDGETNLLGGDETLIDEEILRELISDIVREELQGALGERITRNVRKLVRREIHRALAAQDLE